MQAYLLDWLSLLLRWAHVAAAIAWLGASFYLPQHRLKREAYGAWLTGFALLAATYYANAELFLIDPAVMPLSQWAAIALSALFLVVSYSIYEGLCRSPLGRNALALWIVLIGLLALAAWGLTRVFSARGAFIHYGAMLGTIMVANIAHVFVPAERRAARAIEEGRAADAGDAARVKQRSEHNAYLALPAIFSMISTHYPVTWHWLVLAALTLAGALIGAGFVMRHTRPAALWSLVPAIGLILAAGFFMRPKGPEAGSPLAYDDVKQVIDAHCLSCHAEKPAFPGLGAAPKGVVLDTRERVEGWRAQIRQQTVLTRAMPPGNLTAMSDAERALLDRWAGVK